MSLFIKKPLEQLLAQAQDSEKSLKRSLSAYNLVALGIGAIIGAGLFSITGVAAATNAGRGDYHILCGRGIWLRIRWTLLC